MSTQLTVYFDDKEDKKITEYSKRTNISKHDTIKKMVRDFEEVKNE